MAERDESSASLLAGFIAVFCRPRCSIGNDSLELSRGRVFAQTQLEANGLVALVYSVTVYEKNCLLVLTRGRRSVRKRKAVAQVDISRKISSYYSDLFSVVVLGNITSPENY